jgi:MFS family permease
VTTAVDVSLRAVFRGRRGRLLAGLLLAEFGAAVQSVAYSSVLPLASRELSGSALYGATLASGALATIGVLALGPRVVAALSAGWTLAVATGLYLAGVVAAAAAPTMGFVLAGSIARGIAAGLLAGFGLTAIGGLYEDALRARVLGMFAVVWLLPSLVGPVFNAAVAVTFGWRWAMAWPAVVVVVARALIGRDVGIIPWQPARSRLALFAGAAVLCGLIAASVAPSLPGAVAVPDLVPGLVLAAGLVVATVASTRILHVAVPGDARRFRTLVCFYGLCLAFFGGAGLVALAAMEGLGYGVVAASVIVGAGLVAWAVTGLRPPRRDAATAGLLLLAIALGAQAVALAAVPDPTVALALAVGTWAVGGFGMGLSYPRLMAGAFDDLAPERVTPVATAVAFAETAATAVGSLVGGGLYSVASAAGVATGRSLTWAFALLAAIAAATVTLSTRRR